MLSFLQKNKPAGYIIFTLGSFVVYILFNNLTALSAKILTGDFSSFYFFGKGNLCLASAENFKYNTAYLFYYILVLLLKTGVPVLLIHRFKQQWLLLHFSLALLWYDLFSIACFYFLARGSTAGLLFYGFSAVPFIVAGKNITHSFYIMPCLTVLISFFYGWKYLRPAKNILLFIALSAASILISSLILNILYKA